MNLSWVRPVRADIFVAAQGEQTEKMAQDGHLLHAFLRCTPYSPQMKCPLAAFDDGRLGLHVSVIALVLPAGITVAAISIAVALVIAMH